uniref:Uncharacterized protein n=1 Tax=Hyaloperonospora arabidopsidis (strain Emoy2) TaxID=559515 RepID=M4BYS8_HYAAE
MGAASSKTAAATSFVARNHVIRSNLTLAQVVTLSRSLPSNAGTKAAAPSLTLDSSIGSNRKLLEMPHDMWKHVEQAPPDYDRVQFLEEKTRAFEATASGHRPRSSQPIRLPTDKTNAASSTGAGGNDEAPMQGRLTARDLRTLLRLYYATPESWTPDVLAEKYGLDVATMRGILNSVGPPNVLPPRGTSDHPLGVWFDAPGTLPSHGIPQ